MVWLGVLLDICPHCIVTSREQGLSLTFHTTGYVAVKKASDLNEAEQEFLTDVYLSCKSGVLSCVQRWPNRGHIAHLLKTQCASKIISIDNLTALGVPHASAGKLYFYYMKTEGMKSDPPSWLQPKTHYTRSSWLELEPGAAKPSLGSLRAPPPRPVSTKDLKEELSLFKKQIADELRNSLRQHSSSVLALVNHAFMEHIHDL